MADPKLLQAANQLKQAVMAKETEISDARKMADSVKQDVDRQITQIKQDADRQVQQLQQQHQQQISQHNAGVRVMENELKSLRHQAQDMQTQAQNETILPR